VASYILRRLAWMIPTLLGITLVVFVAVHAAPGDPTLAHGMGDQPGLDVEAHAARLRADHLLDQPLWKQYLHFLGPFDLGPGGHHAFGGSGAHPWHGLLALDFGREFQRADVDVASEIGRRLLVTVPLALASLALTYFVAVPLGVWCAARNGRRRERALSIGLFALHAVPAFWMALLLILFFGASGLGWLPVLGLHDKDAQSMGFAQTALDVVRHAVLPVLALSLGSLAYLSRQVKSGVLGVMREDFMRTARAKGLSERDALVRHGLRNALLPVITLAGSVLPALVGGSVIVETAFGIEGIGRYAYEGMLQRDFNVILATTTLSAVLTLLGILAADVAYALADPRIRLQARHG
jgi:peptide/nickel transport system permease protein